MMNRRFNAVQTASGWPVIYKQITDRYGETAAKDLFDRAGEIFKKYASEYNSCKGIKRMHVMAATATGSLYLPLKEITGPEGAVRMLTEAVKPFSVAKHQKIEKLPAALFMKVAQLITSCMFSEKAGFQRKWHSNTKTEKRYDLLTCPYVEILNTMGCPEVCPAICIQDDYSFADMKNGVIFERKKTLGRGDDCCDFRFRIPSDDNQ